MEAVVSWRVHRYRGEAAPNEACDEFDRTLYQGDPLFRLPSPPPASSTRFVLSTDDIVRGHATVLENEGINVDGMRTALIGWYECVDEPDAAETLLGEVAEWCKAEGFSRVLGPMNGDTWHSYRFAMPSAEPPFMLDLHHKSWYPTQFHGAGFESVAGYYSSRIPVDSSRNGRIGRFVDRFAERGIRIREIDPDRFEEELSAIHAVSVAGFQHNLFYTPLCRESMIAMYSPLREMIDPSFVLIAETTDGEPVGFVFALPDRLAPENTSLVVKTVAATPVPAARGLGTLLVEMIHERARDQGYSSLVHAMMHEKNASRNVHGERSDTIREYRLYCLHL